MAELLFWPALLAYGEAALAYLGEARRPGLAGSLATSGVRIGWLVQTALLAVQAARADGFPWSTWAGSLNLFVWFVVGAYLIWGCQARYRLLGLTVLPLASVLFKSSGPDMSGTMFFAFCVSWAAMLALAATLYHVELAGKRLDARLKELREVLAS